MDTDGFTIMSEKQVQKYGVKMKRSTCFLHVITNVAVQLNSFSPVHTPVNILYDGKSPFAHTVNVSAHRFDLVAFSRLSHADKTRVIETKIQLIADEHVDDAALRTWTTRVFSAPTVLTYQQ
jgi:hypothetical protein